MSNQIEHRFYWHEQRQVNVHDIPGVRYLPCMPVIGASHAVTRIENGTFIRYVRDLDTGLQADDRAWVFQLSERPDIEFVVPVNFLPYLWKVKKTVKPRR